MKRFGGFYLAWNVPGHPNLGLETDLFNGYYR